MNEWKRKAIRKMKSGRELTLSSLAKLSPQEIRKPRTQGKWSVKDVFAHFVAWENVAVERLIHIRKGHYEKVHFFENMAEANRFNARAVKRLSKLSWKKLLNHAEEVRRDLETELTALPEQELDNPAHRYPVNKWLPEFAWDHEAGHRTRIQAQRRKVAKERLR